MLYRNLHITLASNSKVLKLNVILIGGKTDFPWDTYVVFVWDHNFVKYMRRYLDIGKTE